MKEDSWLVLERSLVPSIVPLDPIRQAVFDIVFPQIVETPILSCIHEQVRHEELESSALEGRLILTRCKVMIGF